MKNKVHKKLIEDHIAESKITERLATWDIAIITKDTDQQLHKELSKWILSLYSSKEIAQTKFYFYLESLLPKKEQIFNGELSDKLYKLWEYEENNNYQDMYSLARTIFMQHKHILSFDTASKVLLLLANDYIQSENYEDAMVLLSSIETHEKHLNKENKTHFLSALTRCLYIIGTETKNTDYLTKVVDYSYHVLSNSTINKPTLKETFIMQINALRLLWDHESCLLAIKEYFHIFPLDTRDDIAPQIMYIQWDIYASMRRYNLSIQSFKLYLKFNPNDQIVKTKIREIAEKEWEEERE